MAATAISGLTALTAPAVADQLIVVDDSAGDNKSLALGYLARASDGQGPNVTGGGTVALGGFTLTVPATGTAALTSTAALLATANVFTAAQVIERATASSGTITSSSDFLELYLNDDTESINEGAAIVFTSDFFSGSAKTIRSAIRGGTEQAGNTARGFLAFHTNAVAADSAPEAMRIDSNGNVLIGTNTDSGGKLQVVQSATGGNIPVLRLDQADTSDEFIEFVSTVGAGLAIDTAAIGTYYGKVRVSVAGVGNKFIALYNT